MSDYHRPTDKAVECAISDCEFAASDIDALAVPIGKMTLRHVVEEVKAVRTKLAAAEADAAHEKKCADGYHRKWMKTDAKLKAVESELSTLREERESVAKALLASGEYTVTGEDGQSVHHKYNLEHAAKLLVNERATLRAQLSALREDKERLVKLCERALGRLDALMGDSDLDNDESEEMQVCQALRQAIDSARK